MAKDFMQDILPKDEPLRPPRRLEIAGDEVQIPITREPEPVPERSIRNINVNRPRPFDRPAPERPMDRREVPPVGGGLPRPRGMRSSLWLWILAAILLILLAVVALFMFRSTTITVIPRAHTVVFDSSKTFTAYPSASAAAGTLTYTLQTFDIDDSQAVTSQGTTHAEHKASGSVTVVNDYSSAPVRLVKSTRFQSPTGLIFRAPADITVPGMKGTAAGSVDVTLVADAAGDNYNIGPTAKFTLPGLQGGAMYDKVSAHSSASFSGGFSGDEPNVTDAERAAAVAEMLGRLKDKITQQLSTLAPTNGTIFPSFASVTFEDMPATPATAQGQVNLNERAHVQVPVLPTQDLNRQIGGTVSADAESADLTLNAKNGFGATLVSNASTTVLGSSPITFSLAGTAELVWQIDSGALAQALAGKDQSAFQTIVNGFPGIQEARARIEPFWRHTFPTDPKAMQIILSAPQESVNQ